ncbi:hypothetical protein ABN235_19025, partial [Morganella morganii]
ILAQGVRWKIGNGHSVNVWHDRWIGNNTLISSPEYTIPRGGHFGFRFGFFGFGFGFGFSVLKKIEPFGLTLEFGSVSVRFETVRFKILKFQHFLIFRT